MFVVESLQGVLPANLCATMSALCLCTQRDCDLGVPNQHSEGRHRVCDRGRQDVQHAETTGQLQEVTLGSCDGCDYCDGYGYFPVMGVVTVL